MLHVHGYDRRHSPQSSLRWEAASAQEPKGWHTQHSLGEGPHCTPPPWPPRASAAHHRASEACAPPLRPRDWSCCLPFLLPTTSRTFARRSVFLLVLLLGPTGDAPMSLLRSARSRTALAMPPSPPAEEVPWSLAPATAATSIPGGVGCAQVPGAGKRAAIPDELRRQIRRPAVSTFDGKPTLSAFKEEFNPQSPRGRTSRGPSTDIFPARRSPSGLSQARRSPLAASSVPLVATSRLGASGLAASSVPPGGGDKPAPQPVPWALKGSAISLLGGLGPKPKAKDLQDANNALGFRSNDNGEFSRGRLQRAAALERGELASPPTGAGKESTHVPKKSKKDGKQLSFGAADAMMSEATSPQPRANAISIDATKPILRSLADVAIERDRLDDVVRAKATPSGDAGAPVKLVLKPLAAAAAGRALPSLQRPPLAMSKAEVDASVEALLEFAVDKHGYPLPPEEITLLRGPRDSEGRVDVVLYLHGFAVKESNRWLNPAGNGIAGSMQPAAQQAASMGMLQEGAKAVFLDAHVLADHWDAGGNLNKELIRTMGRYAPPLPPWPDPSPLKPPAPQKTASFSLTGAVCPCASQPRQRHPLVARGAGLR